MATARLIQGPIGAASWDECHVFLREVRKALKLDLDIIVLNLRGTNYMPPDQLKVLLRVVNNVARVQIEIDEDNDKFIDEIKHALSDLRREHG
jgi:hypothetical protein